MKTFQTSTQIVPIVSVGTYWGWFEYERLWGYQEESDREEGRFVCNDYSRRKLGQAIVETANEVFEEEKPFEDVGVRSIKATGFGSPREYNFMDDWLDLKFEVEDDFFDRAEASILAPENRKAVEDYIGEHWCSRDGFTSFMPCTKSNGHWGESGKRYEDPDVEELRTVFKALRGELEVPEYDEWRWFGGVAALLYAIALKDRKMHDDTDEFWGSLTGCLLEKFECNHALGDFCTIMDLDEAEEKYHVVKELLELADRYRRDIEGSLRKYLESGVPEAAKKRVREEADGRMKWLAKFEDDVRDAVEQNHPNENAVEYELAELRQKWTDMFGEDENEKVRDLPGQMLLGGGLS